MSLEDIERKFYSTPLPEKKETQEVPPPQAPSSVPVPAPERQNAEGEAPAPSPWKETAATGGHGLKRIFVIAVIAVVVIAGAAGGIFAFNKFFGTPVGAAASIGIFSPLQMQRGVPFEARIEVTNESEREISGTLKIVLSPGLLQSGGGSEIEEPVPPLAPQETYEKKIPLFAVGDVGKNEKVSAEFVSGAGSVSGEKEIYIRESGIRLTVTPRQIPGENSLFEIAVRYENLSGVSFKDASLEFKYPGSFSFSSASPAPSEGKGVWSLGEVRPRAEGTITIMGTLSQSQGGAVSIPVSFVTEMNGEKFSLVEESAVLSAAQSPLLVSVLAGGRDQYVASVGVPVVYRFSVRNNTDAGLSDVVAVVSLKGVVFDFSRVETRGTYDSVNHTVRFTAAQIPRFRSLSAKESADLSITASLVSAFPMKTESDKNFTVGGTIEVTSPTVPHNSTADKTFVSVPFSHKVAGDTDVVVQAWRKDPWGIVNAGTLPLAPNKSTQYTVHWTIKNYATDVKEVKISSGLPQSVRFTGVVRSNAPTTPVVNDRTGLVEWTLPLVPAGKGVVNSAYEAAFQIEVTPNVTQSGGSIGFLEGTTLTATDVWTGTVISKQVERLDSSIPHDPTYKQGDDIVSK